MRENHQQCSESESECCSKCGSKSCRGGKHCKKAKKCASDQC
jgi:hypothetical protein